MTTSRRILVTGASSGIGEATARLLASRGYRVVGIARRSERLAAIALDTGIEVHTIDVTNEDDTDWIAEHLRATGGIDAVLNIAGGATDAASVLDADPNSWRTMFELNVIGVQRIIAKTVNLLRDSARTHGHADILTVTSTAGFTPYETGGGYNVAKYGARALMGVLRLELAGEPIRVIDVAPGQVKTEEFALHRFGGDTAKYDALYDGVEQPLTADDVAHVIVSTLELPGHVNIDQVVVRPVAQAAQHKLHRGPLTPKD
ncbi:NADP-dependent 3-hydroxy acid dehydrogenase YdfG [Microbacteriaceae bacterium MWH-Ta3]|nr:NADP-dependent 3-hydroxy acid dehydrogenase YdfG [Microbacteriaceae bacterium MWH-Ta3]